MSTTVTRPTDTRLTQILLACGVFYAVPYVVAAGLYAGHDRLSQAPQRAVRDGLTGEGLPHRRPPGLDGPDDRLRDRRPAGPPAGDVPCR
jgi:hypothetical protein